MLENCRICCESIQGISAKNLFDEKQTILIHHLELLTGEWLTNQKNAPSYICICCEQDLKVSVALRERCIKSQRKLQEKNMCASEAWVAFDHVNDSIIHEPFDELSLDKKLEVCLPFEDENELELERDKSPHKSSPEQNALISPPKKRRKLINWRFLTEEQIKDLKRKQRRRDCVCDQCGRQFTDPSNLNVHLIRHTGIKNFECDVCGSKFYTPHLLKRHKIIHSETSNFRCDFCDRTFKHSKSKIEHERIHRNDKPYKCDQCDKCFTTLSKCKDHQVAHTGLRRFHCELCDQHFMRKRHLKTHFLSKTHKNKEK